MTNTPLYSNHSDCRIPLFIIFVINQTDMNYPFPYHGQAAMQAQPYAQYPYPYPYPYPQWPQQYPIPGTSSISASSSYLAPRWHAALSPNLIILVIMAGVIGWWQFGSAFLGNERSRK